MKRFLFLLIITTLLLCSCTSNSDFQPIKIEYDTERIKSLEEAIEFDGYSLFLDELHMAEYTVIENDKTDTPYPILEGDATYLKLEMEGIINIYEYDHAKSLYEGIYSIHNNGYSIDVIKKEKVVSGIEISWANKPNFYLFKNLIVLYVGQDEDLVKFLDRITDEKITQ